MFNGTKPLEHPQCHKRNRIKQQKAAQECILHIVCTYDCRTRLMATGARPACMVSTYMQHCYCRTRPMATTARPVCMVDTYMQHCYCRTRLMATAARPACWLAHTCSIVIWKLLRIPSISYIYIYICVCFCLEIIFLIFKLSRITNIVILTEV